MHIKNSGTGTSVIIEDSTDTPTLAFSNAAASDYASVGFLSGGLALSGTADATSTTHMFLSNSGDVGIGTTSPVTTLDVTGTDAIIVPQGTTAQRPGVPENGMIRYNSDNTKMEFYENGSWANLGSGALPAGADQQIQFNNSGAFGGSSNLLWDGFSLKVGTGAGSFSIQSNGQFVTGSDFTLYPGGTERFKITANNSPEVRIKGNGSTSNPRLYFWGFGGSSHFEIGRNSSEDGYIKADANFDIQTGGATTRMRVDSNGKVGVGTTSPATKLEVTGGGIRFDGSNPVTNHALESTADMNLVADADLTGAGIFRFHSGKTGSLVELMRIDGDGNVGIGTTSPGRLLHVNGPMRLTASALPGSPAAGDIAVDSGDSNKLKYYDGSSWVEAGGSSADGHSLDAADGSPSDVLYVYNDGKIGVNSTIKALSDFDIRSSTGGAKLLFSHSPSSGVYSSSGIKGILSGGNAELGFYTTDNTLSNGDVSVERMRIDPKGNVGIGTTNPSAKLEVAGQSRSVNSSGVTQVNGTASVDWNNGNAQSLSVDCATTAFSNMLDGGTYILAISETGTTTCTFSQAGLTFYYSPANGARTSGQRTVYSFQRIGTDVYVSWVKGFQ